MLRKPTKAKVTILEGSRRDESFDVLFNPTEYAHEIGNKFQETALPGLETPVLQFVNGEAQTLSMDLFFDTWTNRGGTDVTAETEKISCLLAIDADLHAPPPVRVTWGALAFTGVVQSVSQRFTMFNAAGQPVRATLSVTFKQYKTLSEQLNTPRRMSSDKTKLREPDGGLWLLAHREYGDAREWRRIASHNGVRHPRLVDPGETVVLPPLRQDHEP